MKFNKLGILSSNMVLASCYVVSVFCFTIALLVLEMKEQWED